MSKTIIKSDNFFVIRNPKKPIGELFALAADKTKLRSKLKDWIEKPEVIEAIYLASPSLLERIDLWKNKPESKSGKKIEQTLLKYLIRMSSRSTPFGLFSGIHLGEIGNETKLSCNGFNQDHRVTRLDMFYLSGLKEQVLKKNIENVLLKYYPNPECYFVAGQYRYIEAYQSDESRQYRLSEVEVDEYFNYLIELSKEGLNFEALTAGFIKKFPESESDDVKAYIEQLIEESILVAKLPLPITGKSPDLAFIESLKSINESDIVDHLSTAKHQIEKFDQQRFVLVDDYKKIVKTLSQLPVKPKENKLFQVDSYRSFSQCSLNQEHISRLSNQLLLLKQLGKKHHNPFNNFANSFNARFEGQFVALDKLLDDESGISFSTETGYETGLLAGLNIHKIQTGVINSDSPSVLDTVINKTLTLPENRTKQTIQLHSKQLRKHVEQYNVELPVSFSAMISLYEDYKQQPLMMLNGCTGPSAANLLGRFCHLNEDLKNKVQQHLKAEEKHSSDVIFAEVVHMPDGRPGNVIARPHLRQFEIVFMADSTLNPDYQIPVSDLYVFVEGTEVKLWSKRLEKRIIPRMSSAHNYSARSLSVYKFLCMLQHQDASAPHFELPSALNTASFVPRIILDNLILSEKMWRIPRQELAEVYKNEDLDFNKLTLLQKKYQLDNWVSFSRGDNILTLNLHIPAMFDILLSETVGVGDVELKEVIINQYKTPVKSEQGEFYKNEIVIPFLNMSAKSYKVYTDNPQANIQENSIKRRYAPGSPWLSLKIYSGNTSVEALLADRLFPLIEQNLALFNKWFFIRYSDPDWHIRLRFFGEPAVLYGQLLPKLNEVFSPLLDEGLIHKVELFTYEREVERYGGPQAMELIESLFMKDSELIARVMQAIPEHSEDLRWRTTLLMTEQLLTSLNFSHSEKLKLISELRVGFGHEFNESNFLRKQLGNKYREIEHIFIEDFSLFGSEGKSETQQILFSLVNEWRLQSEPLLGYLNELVGEGLNCSKDSLLKSLLHMHNNRMFKAYGREQEFVMHDFLRRYYFSQSKIT